MDTPTVKSYCFDLFLLFKILNEFFTGIAVLKGTSLYGCVLEDFLHFSKLILSQNLTKQRSSENIILPSFSPKITSKEKIVWRRIYF
jgi:hypothetical protein